MIIALRPPKVACTKVVPFSSNDLLDKIIKKIIKILILFLKNSAALEKYVFYMHENFCSLKQPFRPSKAAPTKIYALSFV